MDKNINVNLGVGTGINTDTESSDPNRHQTVDSAVTASINGKIFVPELYKPTNKDQIRVISHPFNSCYIYAWNHNDPGKIEEFGGWPGKYLGAKEGDEHYASANTFWSIIDKSKSNHLIFNNNNGSQTKDLDVPKYQDLTYRYDLETAGYSPSQAWKRTYYFGSWHKYSDWIKTEYNTWKTTDYVTFQQSAAAGY